MTIISFADTPEKNKNSKMSFKDALFYAAKTSTGTYVVANKRYVFARYGTGIDFIMHRASDMRPMVYVNIDSTGKPVIRVTRFCTIGALRQILSEKEAQLLLSRGRLPVHVTIWDTFHLD